MILTYVTTVKAVNNYQKCHLTPTLECSILAHSHCILLSACNILVSMWIPWKSFFLWCYSQITYILIHLMGSHYEIIISGLCIGNMQPTKFQFKVCVCLFRSRIILCISAWWNYISGFAAVTKFRWKQTVRIPYLISLYICIVSITNKTHRVYYTRVYISRILQFTQWNSFKFVS